jgi:thioredoxin reductase
MTDDGDANRLLDCVIVGGGPAGLSAALMLGRCRRRVVLCDTGQPRNAPSQAMHGFLSRDGISPLDLLRIGREQLGTYPSVEIRQLEVLDLKRVDEHFESVLADGTTLLSRTALLATGVKDDLPKLDGISTLYGRSVFHCPYCDGWEVRDQSIAIYGNGKSGAGLAQTLSIWSDKLSICTDGKPEFSRHELRRLKVLGIQVFSERIKKVVGRNGQLERIAFEGGKSLACSAMFIHTHQHQGSCLPARLGCEDKKRRTVPTGKFEVTSIPGLYVAGDASRDVQLVIVAASEGAQAAFDINKSLLKADLAALEQTRVRPRAVRSQ